MYYPCSENKDADQLRGYREADLRLCFRPCKLLVFSRTGSCVNDMSPGCQSASTRLFLYQLLELHVRGKIQNNVYFCCYFNVRR